MHKQRIFIVDDEPKIVRILTANLKSIGYEVNGYSSGKEALAAIDLFNPDLILLDLMMPEMDGFSVLEKIRCFSEVPVIILTARDQSEDKVQGLNMGADDYLTKPFSIDEVFARVNAVLRRTAKQALYQKPTAKIVNGAVELDLAQTRILVKGQEVRFTGTEYKLFALLMQHMDKVMTHEQLLQAVWGAEYSNDVDYLRVAIARIRQKLRKYQAEEDYIKTYVGIGYLVKRINER